MDKAEQNLRSSFHINSVTDVPANESLAPQPPLEQKTVMHIKYTKLLAKVSFISLIISSLLFPTGTFADIPVKHITYLACVTTLFACWFKGARIEKAYLSLFVACILFVVFYSLVGSLHSKAPFYFVFTEAQLFIATMTVVLFILMAKSCKIIEDEEIVLSAFYGVFFFALWKFIAILLLHLNIISFGSLMHFFEKYAGYPPVTSGIPGGYIRLAFISQDFATALFLFLIPAYPKMFSKVPRFLRIAFMLTGVVAVLFSYSRYYFGFLLILWFYIFLFKFSFMKRLLACATVSVILLLSLPWLIDVFNARFMSDIAKESDNIRHLQIAALLNAWEDLPILGGGLGYYSKEYVRSMFIYEVQWISFLAKFGMIGGAFLFFLISLLFYKILSGKKSLDHYVLAFTLFCFLLGGFTNPFLVNSTSAMFYVLPLIVASILRKELLESPQSNRLGAASAQSGLPFQTSRPQSTR